MLHRTSRPFGPAGVEDLPERLSAVIEEMMSRHRIPGLSLAVTTPSRLLYAAGFGNADLAAAVPATPETAYLWFSMSKIVTATAALVLADQGALDLDSPITEHLPYVNAPRSGTPTVRQLMNHTAGLDNPLPLRWVHTAAEAAPDPEVLLRRLLSRRRAFRHRPGHLARYSNVGYLALGQIVSVAAAMPFERYVHQAVLDPVGMGKTGFDHPAGSRTATGYVRAPLPVVPLLRAVLPAGIAGRQSGGYLALNDFHVDGPAYGGLIGSVLDASRFLRMHLNDGQIDGQRILATGTAARMRQIDRAGKPFSHGLGWFRQPGPGTPHRVEHLGAGAGFWNVMRLYPDQGVGVVVMTNGTTRYDFEPLMTSAVEASCS